MDNTTCVVYINYQGGTIFTELSNIAEDLQELYLKRKIILKAEHILGILNKEADNTSRMIQNQKDWMLNPIIFTILNQI